MTGPEADRPHPADFPLVRHGNHYDDFAVGDRFEHHWGRTICDGDALLFATLTLAYNPNYLNAEHARSEGHRDLVVSPMLALCTVVGLSVEDLSEAGGPFLGLDDVQFHRPVHPGVTLTAFSEVVDMRRSNRHPTAGIVTWRTEGRDENGDLVVAFRRTNLIFDEGTLP